VIEVGEVFFSTFKDIASKERLDEWFAYQSREQKSLYYLLPSMKWFQSARKLQPGLSFQTFDDLATLLLKSAGTEFTPITEEERVLLFYEILKRTMKNLPEKEFSLKAKAYAESYGQLKRLGLTVEKTPEPMEELKEAFFIYEHDYRDEQRLYDPENRIFKAVETEIRSTSFPLSHVVIDGYIDFGPVQYQLIEYLVESSVPCTIYMTALDTPLIHETVTTLKSLGMIIHQETIPSLESICQKTTVTAATTMEEEIYGVLETIAQTKEKEHYSQFGIVLANEQGYLPELERISAKIQVPIKRVKKKPLAETNFLSFLQQVLEKQELKSKWDHLSLIDTVAKLCFLTQIEFNKLKQTFIRTGEWDHDEITSIMRSVKQFQAGLPEGATAAAYRKNLHRFLDDLQLPLFWKKRIKARIPSRIHHVALEMRAYKCVKDILTESFEAHPVMEITLYLETFRNQLLQRLNKESLYIDRAPTDGVEIYSFRDVPLFKGTRLFVLGLNEGEFPKQIDLKGYFQERYVEGIASPFPIPVAAYFRKRDDASFAQLHYLAENLSFSFVEGVNPNQPLLPSKHLMELTGQPAMYSTISRFTSDTFLTKDEYEEKLAYYIGIGKMVNQSPPLLEEYQRNLTHLQLGEERISSKWAAKLASNRINITRLESYASCSFKFALEKWLKVQDPLEQQTMIDPIETGNMLHRMIEKFYQEAKGVPFHQLHSFFHGREEEKLADIFETEWGIILEKHLEIPKYTLDKEKEEWWNKLRRWLTAEKLRFWQNEELADMSIFQLEEPVELTIELDTNNILTLTGKIDRIDIDEHGFVIYDYKSSFKGLDFETDVPGGLVLQIPLYMIALEHEFKQGKYQKLTIENGEAIGGGYISIKEPQLRKKNTVWKDEEHKRRFEPNNRIKTNVIPLSSELLKQDYGIPELIAKLWRGTFTDFSVKPFSTNSCKYCRFKPICRVTKEQQDS
jgi:ATP-dependent helicase/DNAse subunit B